MRKYLLVLFAIGFFAVSFWENLNDSWVVPENFIQSGQTKIITQDLNTDAAQELQNIKAVFCDPLGRQETTDRLTFEMRPWQRKEICMAFFNIWDKPISLLFWFSEGQINKNGDQVCDGDMTNKNNFSKFILQNPTTEIIVPAQGNVIKRVYYFAPKNSSWEVFGCLAYKLNRPEEIEKGKMFLLVLRKVRYIDINVTWNVYNYWWRDDIKSVYTNNSVNVMRAIVAIIALRIIITIFSISKKKNGKGYKKK